MPDRDDQQVERLVPDFVTRQEGIPIWKLQDLGTFFDPDDLLMTLRFDDHRLLDPGTLGNYFVGTRDERILNTPANAAATSRGNLTLVPSLWSGLPAVKTLPAATNLIVAPSFELWTAGAPDSWTIYQTPTTTQDNTIGYSGASALHIVANHVGDTEGWYIDVAGLTPAATYTAAVWLYGISGTCRFFVSDGGGVANPVVSSAVSEFGRWERRSVQKVCPGSGSIRIWMANFTVGNHEMVFDGAGLYALGYDPGHVDGDQGDGYSWAGTPHATTSARVANYLNLDSQVTQVSGNDTLSFAMWIQMPYDATATWPAAFGYLFFSAGAAGNQISLVFDPANNNFRLYINTGWSASTTVQTFEAGDWMHIVCTIDFTSDEYQIYIDGILGATDATAFAAPTLTTWILGHTTSLVGFMRAEYVVVDRILTSVEVANLYAMRRPVIDPGAVDKDLNAGIVAYKASAQSTNHAAVTTILLDTVFYNEHLVLDVVTGRVYITQPGWYIITGRIDWASNAAGYRDIRILTNTTTAGIQTSSAAPAAVVRQIAVAIEYLIPGDWVTLACLQTSGGALNANTGARYGNYLTVVKMRNVFAK